MTSIHIHNVRAVTAGAATPVYRDGECIGTSRCVQIWTHDGLVEVSLYAEEASVLAFPSDPVERQQLHFARHDAEVYRHALEQIVNTNRDPVTVALEVLGDD
jgi:hypothetical protein